MSDFGAHEQLIRQLALAIHPLTEQELTHFISIWHSCQYSRKQLVTRTGETEKYLYIVVEGIQRVFYTDDENREATLVFTYPPSFGGVLDALLLQQPSKYDYESLTPSVLLRASYTDLAVLMEQHKGVAALVQKGVSAAASGLLERLVEVQCYSSEDRFKKLLKRSPHLLTLIPHKYIANYLGINPTNFSKLINQVKI